jgi:hypothetical protein
VSKTGCPKSSKNFNDMKTIDMDSLKTAWKNEQGFENKKLSEKDIQQFLGQKSRDITQLFRKGLIFDGVLKSLIGISLVGIMILYAANHKMLMAMAALLAGLCWTLWFQWKMYRKIPRETASSPVIRTSLENRIRFYRKHFVKSLYIGALSNVLIFVSGSLYYFYFRYGEVRPLDLTDYLVFTMAILLAFAIGALVQIAQHNFQVRQLESCLKEIDEDAMTMLTLKDQRNKRLRLIFIALTAVILGLLLLTYMIFR